MLNTQKCIAAGHCVPRNNRLAQSHRRPTMMMSLSAQDRRPASEASFSVRSATGNWSHVLSHQLIFPAIGGWQILTDSLV